MIVTKNEVLFKSNFVEVSYDAANKIIIAKWNGFLKLEDVKKACDVINSYVKKYQVSRHLSDQSQMRILSKEIQEHVATKVFPELENLGLRKMAVVISEDVFAVATANNVHTKAKVGRLSVNTYNSVNQATSWLVE
jgi:nitrogen regulatory protein PII-like uncharacterized protein